MKKNIDEQTAKLFEAARTAFIENYSTGVIKSPIAKNVAAAEIGRFFSWLVEDKKLKEMIPNCQTYEKPEYQRRRRAIANNIKKCGFSVNLQDENKVINLIDGYQCGIMALPRIYSELCRLVGEKPVELAAWPINENAQPAPSSDATGQDEAPVAAAPAAGYMSGETTRGRVYYINNNDKPVSRVVDLERINYNSQLPMWIMPENDCDFIVFQLSNNIFFRANGCCIPENYRAALRGDYSVYDEKTIANDMANAAAIPEKQFTPEYWPNMAVVNAYQAAGMVEEAKKLLSIREEIEKTREEKKKARQQENERKELERKQAEEKQLNESAAQFINGGTITAEDVVKLCDRENITINPRTRHNLLEVVSYFENNGSTIHYRYHGKRKPVLNGCFSVVKALRERLTQAAADMAEAPAADVVETPAADVVEAPVADMTEAPAADMAESPAADEPDPDAIGEIVTIPASQKNAFNDAVILAQAARIKSNYEAMKQQAAAEAFADAITAYCAAMEEPAAPAWAPEIITVTPCPVWDDTPAVDAAPAPRRRRFAPRLRPVLRRLGRVAAVVLPLLIVALFMGASTGSTASAPAAVTTCQASAATVAQVVELPALTVTASSLTTAPAAPSPVKKLAAPSPVKKAAADAVTLPNQKTASALATATAPAADDADSLTTAPAADGLQPTPPDGLTICAGTPWAYTMMNWA